MDNNKKIKSFTELTVWQEAHKLVLLIYKTTDSYPKTEVFGLTSQMRRAAVSITSNIAEGFSHSTYTDKIHFYIISKGSLTELQDQLLIARDLKYLNNKDFQAAADLSITVHKLLNGLIRQSKTKV